MSAIQTAEEKNFDGFREFEYLGGRYRTNSSATAIQCLYADGKFYSTGSLGVMKAAKDFVKSL